MRVFLKTLRGQTLIVELELGNSLFQIHAAARTAYEAVVGLLDADQFVTLIIRGEPLCCREEAMVADRAIRDGGPAPAFINDELRAGAFLEDVPLLAVIHLVVQRRP